MPQAKSDGRTILDRISKPTAVITYVAATIYGMGGTGKTTLAGTMPGKGLLIDIPQIEGGAFVLADQASHVDVYPARSWEDLGDIHRHLRDGTHDYKWYCIDTVTATQELAKRKTLKEREVGADPHTISMQDWGKIGELQADMFYQFRAMPMHGIFLAQEKLRVTGDDSRYEPNVSPAALDKLVPSMTIIGRLYTSESRTDGGETVLERRLRLGPSARTYSKARALKTRPVPAIVKDPHLGKLFAWMLGAASAKPPTEAVDESLAIMEIE